MLFYLKSHSRDSGFAYQMLVWKVLLQRLDENIAGNSLCIFLFFSPPPPIGSIFRPRVYSHSLLASSSALKLHKHRYYFGASLRELDNLLYYCVLLSYLVSEIRLPSRFEGHGVGIFSILNPQLFSSKGEGLLL